MQSSNGDGAVAGAPAGKACPMSGILWVISRPPADRNTAVSTQRAGYPPCKGRDRQTARQRSATAAGYAWMSLAVLIWASWLVLTSAGRTTSLSVLDLAGFRAVIPTVVLGPLLWRHRRIVARLGAARCLLLSVYGAPFTLLVGHGLGFAPVAHAGAMVPGLMPVFAVALACLFLGQRLSKGDAVALMLIISGAVTILLRGSDQLAVLDVRFGHLLFLLGALLGLFHRNDPSLRNPCVPSDRHSGRCIDNLAVATLDRFRSVQHCRGAMVRHCLSGRLSGHHFGRDFNICFRPGASSHRWAGVRTVCPDTRRRGRTGCAGPWPSSSSVGRPRPWGRRDGFVYLEHWPEAFLSGTRKTRHRALRAPIEGRMQSKFDKRCGDLFMKTHLPCRNTNRSRLRAFPLPVGSRPLQIEEVSIPLRGGASVLQQDSSLCQRDHWRQRQDFEH